MSIIIKVESLIYGVREHRLIRDIRSAENVEGVTIVGAGELGTSPEFVSECHMMVMGSN